MAKNRQTPPIFNGGIWTVTSREQWDIIVYEREGQSIVDFLVRSGPMDLDFFTFGPRPASVNDILSNSAYAGLVFPGQFMKTEAQDGADPDGGGLAVGGTVRLNFDRAGMTEWMQKTYGKQAPELTFEDARKPAEPTTFEVLLSENSSHDDGDLSGTFDSAEEAVNHARGMVDQFFEGSWCKQTDRELFSQFVCLGKAPYIPGVEFSAREYAREWCTRQVNAVRGRVIRPADRAVEAPPPIEEWKSLDAVRQRMDELRPANPPPEVKDEGRAQNENADEAPGGADDPAESLVQVLEAALEAVQRPGNEFMLSTWNSAEEADNEIRPVIDSIRMGKVHLMEEADLLFRATSPLQEVSLSSGWAEEFLRLADRYDKALARHYYGEDDSS